MSEFSSEPTMEEILSSIKKIIADDSDKTLAPPRPRRIVPREPTHDELGTSLVAQRESAQDDAAEDDILELTQESSAAEVAPVELVSATAAAATRNALDSLSAVTAKPEPVATKLASGDSVEAVVRDMLRPMLKEWLDAHLPEIVEAVVAKEVARISGR
jgi:uncharacterized protein